MKTSNPSFTSTHALARRAPIFATAAALLLAPCLYAQSAATPAPAAQPAAESGAGQKSPSLLDDLPPNHPLREKLHSFKYDGGRVSKLGDALRAVFPSEVLFVPVGGITPQNMAAYAAAGANGFGLGSALYKPGATPQQVAINAQAFVSAWWSIAGRAADS